MGPISLLHKMVKLPTVKRLAADIFKCGTNRIWLDPNETAELSLANSRAAVRRLQKKGFILKKPTNNVSRARIRKRNKMRRLGQYRALGKIDNHLYHKLYLQAKGNVFKNKRVLIEHIHHEKAEANRAKAIEQAAIAHRDKVRAARARREARKAEK